MSKRRKLQYTVRDVPPELDNKLRASALSEQISLNQATLRAIERGLGLQGATVRYRNLRKIVKSTLPLETKLWDELLSKLDVVNPDDWK